METPIVIDIVILSYAKNKELKDLTTQCLKTLMASEDPDEIRFSVVVIESNSALKPYQFEHTLTIYPDTDFGFNKYLNIGLDATSNPYICFCNNDLIFHRHWASELLKAMANDDQLESASTYCPIMHKNSGFQQHLQPIEGYENLFSGWCFMIKRSLIATIGRFDEKFEFWYADADYLKTLKKYGIKNALVTTSLVTHLNAVTSKELTKKEYHNLTLMPLMYLNYKWGRDNYIIYKLKQLYFNLRFKLGLLK